MADRPYHHGDLRAVLLANAERALAERGPAALSLRELAREAGVSHAAPGRHFRDKQALLDALALTGFERLADRLAEASAAGGDARAQFLALARAYVRFSIEHTALLELMYARKHDPEISEQLSAAMERLFDWVLRPILHGQATGEITEEDPKAVAVTVSSTLHGFATLNATLPLEEIDARLPHVVRVLFDGLTPR